MTFKMKRMESEGLCFNVCLVWGHTEKGRHSVIRHMSWHQSTQS